MKHTPRTLLFVLIVAVAAMCCVCLSACGADKSRTQFCYDEAGLFGEAQQNSIDQTAKEVQEKYNVNVLVATCGRYNSRADMDGEDFLRQQGLSRGDDYIVIIINATGYQNNYHFDIYTYGSCAFSVKDSEIDAVLYSAGGDAILTSDSAKAAAGVCSCVQQLGQAYRGRIAGVSTTAIVVGSIVIAIVVAAFVMARVARSYSRKRKNITYPLERYAQLNLKEKEDHFTNSVTTFVVLSNGSGSSGGHSSGGGGGGGHRGGR